MPRIEDKRPSIESPTAAIRYSSRRGPLSIRLDGPHHRSPEVTRVRLSTHHRRPRLFKGSKVHPLSENDRQTRSRQRVSATPRPLVRTPQANHLRQGPLLHLSIREGNVHGPRNP